MHCNELGIALTSAELGALLEFASREPTDRDKYGVQFQVKSDRCWARATNGRIDLEADGSADGKHADGEWFIHRDLLVNGRKLVTGKQVLRLEFSGSSLHNVRVEENNIEISTLTWPSDAAVAQVSFPWEKITLPPSNRDVAKCTAVGAAYLGLIEDVAKGAGVEFVDIYPPKDHGGVLIFKVADKGETEWLGLIRPVPSAASTSKQGDDEAPKRKRGGRQTEAFQNSGAE